MIAWSESGHVSEYRNNAALSVISGFSELSFSVLTPPFLIIQSHWLSQGTLCSLWLRRGILRISRVPVQVSRGYSRKFGLEPSCTHEV